MELISNAKRTSVYDEMKLRVYAKKFKDTRYAYAHAQDNLDERLEDIEYDYAMNLFKLDDLADLNDRSEELKVKFVDQKLHLDTMNLSESDKIGLILTTASILNRTTSQAELLTLDELFLMAVAMNKIPTFEYDKYANGDFLADIKVMRFIKDKTTDLNDQILLCDDILEYCRQTKDINDNSKYQTNIDNILKMIEKETFGSRVKVKKIKPSIY